MVTLSISGLIEFRWVQKSNNNNANNPAAKSQTINFYTPSVPSQATPYIRSSSALYVSSTARRLMLPLVAVRGRLFDGTMTMKSGEVIRSWMYRRDWNCRVRLTISFLNFEWSMLTAGSTKRVGEERPLPTTMHCSISCPHVLRTFSSMDWVSHRRPLSLLIQSSSRPREI